MNEFIKVLMEQPSGTKYRIQQSDVNGRIIQDQEISFNHVEDHSALSGAVIFIISLFLLLMICIEISVPNFNQHIIHWLESNQVEDHEHYIGETIYIFKEIEVYSDIENANDHILPVVYETGSYQIGKIVDHTYWITNEYHDGGWITSTDLNQAL